MNGIGGQSAAIAQELCHDWEDSAGKMHPGIYDEENEASCHWAETYPKAVPGCLKLIEPRKFRNALFEAAKILIPLGAIKFAPPCPRQDVLVLEDGTERKLSKGEQSSLLQMDLMKEEMCSMIRIKTPGTGNITYQLPPEKRNVMHDDRNYVAVLSCWQIKNLRDQEEFGDGVELDYSAFFGEKKKKAAVEDPWLKSISNRNTASGGRKVTNNSPFQGQSPFHR